MHILNIRVDNLSKKEILEKVGFFLSDNKFHQIATINPEFILEAQKNGEFRNILNNCDLNVADGVGLKFAFWRNGEKLKERIAGADLMLDILKIANDRGLGVFLVANKNGLSTWEETRGGILKIYPNLKIDGIDIEKNDKGFMFHVSCFRVVFCNFGAPFQEIFLNRQKNATPPHLYKEFSNNNSLCYNKNGNTSDNQFFQHQRCGGKIGVAMGVGGAFDFITGKIHRAPVFVRKLGLEWFWRLILQPRRIKRIFNAIIVFPLKVVLKS